MSETFPPGRLITTVASNSKCQVVKFLGAGTQGEVYSANIQGTMVAVKWFHPDYLEQDPELQARLARTIELGPPNDRFLWPQELVVADGVQGFGYVMPLCAEGYSDINKLVTRDVEPSFKALITAGIQLVDSFLKLHAMGLCYRDISLSNVCMNPMTGDILICDNDNVDFDGGEGAIIGTPRFMAPEIVRGEAAPSVNTDLHCLAVLLFYMLLIHNPFEGKKALDIHCLDSPGLKRIFGDKPVFIFDPNDQTNRPMPGEHDNAIAFWPIYPGFLRERFIEAFTTGAHYPDHRVRESQWRADLVRLRDSILYCTSCWSENFYDREAMVANNGRPSRCWQCDDTLALPPRIRIKDAITMLNHDTELFPHHVDSDRLYDFSSPVAKLVQHPAKPGLWGLKNLSGDKWATVRPGVDMLEVAPGQSITIAQETKIYFGKSEGEIRC